MSDINIQRIRARGSELFAMGTKSGLTSEEKKELALLIRIVNKYESKQKGGQA